jgi:hypothetical protein
MPGPAQGTTQSARAWLRRRPLIRATTDRVRREKPWPGLARVRVRGTLASATATSEATGLHPGGLKSAKRARDGTLTGVGAQSASGHACLVVDSGLGSPPGSSQDAGRGLARAGRATGSRTSCPSEQRRSVAVTPVRPLTPSSSVHATSRVHPASDRYEVNAEVPLAQGGCEVCTSVYMRVSTSPLIVLGIRTAFAVLGVLYSTYCRIWTPCDTAPNPDKWWPVGSREAPESNKRLIEHDRRLSPLAGGQGRLRAACGGGPLRDRGGV